MTSSQLTFFFDPRCPWAWRTSLWVRDLQQRGTIQVQWRIFSLTEINRDPLLAPSGPRTADTVLRVLVLARRSGGQEAIDRLYLALGKARFDRQEDLASEQAIVGALEAAELDSNLLAQALRDSSTSDEALADHDEAVARFGAFGVPWLVAGDQEFGFYGPIIADVPSGDESLALWEHSSWMLTRPYLYEFKRSR